MRKIERPEDAIPRDNCEGFMDSIRGRDSVDAWFTAGECAQIARAYLDCARAVDTGAYGAEEEMDEWESLFTKWEGEG